MSSDPHRIAIGLGASLGDRRATLERTVRRLDRMPGLELLRVSRWYASPPMRGGTARNAFLNGVALYATTLEPLELLAICRAMETQAGRRRARHWGDRPLDLDLLTWDGEIIAHPDLSLPHPGVTKRDFVLYPLLEIWPDATDLPSGRPLADFASAGCHGIVPTAVFAKARRAI